MMGIDESREGCMGRLCGLYEQVHRSIPLYTEALLYHDFLMRLLGTFFCQSMGVDIYYFTPCAP